jgi:Fe-S-cluster-containing dehydrogenase component
MKKCYLIIDVERCEDCNNCFLACKDEFVDNDFPPHSAPQPRHGHRWMNIMRKERGSGSLMDVAYLPIPCMHCDQAPCVRSGRDGAVYRREDGVVLIDPVKARGRRDLVAACPYGVIFWNEAAEVPQKCTLCAHLLDSGWKETRCVQACPTGALRYLRAEDDEMQKRIESEKLEVLHPEYGTRPRVYYRNLYRYFDCFIAGSVAYAHDGIVDCAEGADVTLSRGSEEIAKAVTDAFGDFKFDRLEEKCGTYRIEIGFRDYEKKRLTVELGKSVNLGDIRME